MNDGSQKLLSSYRGKVVVMAFMYTTCTHCQHTAGVLSKINSDYAGKGVQMLGVAIDAGAQQGIPTFLNHQRKLPCRIRVTRPGTEIPPRSRRRMVCSYAGLHRPQWHHALREYSHRHRRRTAGKFIENQEVNIPKEIDKYLKAPVSAATRTKQAPKS